MQSSFKSCFWYAKKGAFWIVIRLESLILNICKCKALLERDSCVHILEMRAEAIHGSICAVGIKHYLAVRRSCLQCLWMLVEITKPIRKRIAIRNGFRNVIRSFVNRPRVYAAKCWNFCMGYTWQFQGLCGKIFKFFEIFVLSSYKCHIRPCNCHLDLLTAIDNHLPFHFAKVTSSGSYGVVLPQPPFSHRIRGSLFLFPITSTPLLPLAITKKTPPFPGFLRKSSPDYAKEIPPFPQ